RARRRRLAHKLTADYAARIQIRVDVEVEARGVGKEPCGYVSGSGYAALAKSRVAVHNRDRGGRSDSGIDSDGSGHARRPLVDVRQYDRTRREPTHAPIKPVGAGNRINGDRDTSESVRVGVA